MSLEPLAALPGDARVWCFGASEVPEADDADRLRVALERFIEGWTAHRADLRAACGWLHDRFLVVSVDESKTGASGCSIYALIAEIRRLESETEVQLLDAAPIWFRETDGTIRRVSRDQFRDLAESGDIGPDTTVFDLTVGRLDEVRTGAWEVAAGRSWHARLL